MFAFVHDQRLLWTVVLLLICCSISTGYPAKGHERDPAWFKHFIGETAPTEQASLRLVGFADHRFRYVSWSESRHQN